jgi:hypothetical protein
MPRSACRARQSRCFLASNSAQPMKSVGHSSLYGCWECAHGRPVEEARHHCLSTLQGPHGRGGQDCAGPKRAWAYWVRMPVLQLRHQCTYPGPSAPGPSAPKVTNERKRGGDANGRSWERRSGGEEDGEDAERVYLPYRYMAFGRCCGIQI